MELRCRVCKVYISCNKLGNKARNARKSGALHTPSLRLDFLAQLFVSRQKVEEETELKPHLAKASWLCPKPYITLDGKLYW